ncbi:hypothetical protein Pmar_PMAR020284 [Perkinsus marinus ATCC 50983]|uniref:DUF4470 domain-containing protein n=1 Tax=Perkinsus marinus (strain ATCC 50983 / TXsc) TaxID=423536 RepID=C5LU29_PERM5|nr:hypothetical protein Pmar_PMAR020284 [Perkinsus marinus ATCC 50983]EEQ99827.1 hypothetical protein Pmar_PMAR020284 [Perkinsus marinus ATCC 50983]|eukprot:XP_002767110.1 hypothetical protein Pmar_PMAR020284 [Perkinsus marinus ATCC 50983]
MAEEQVYLSCLPVASVVSNWTYLYPYANTPPRDLCVTSRGAGQHLPTRAMLLGCSDLISVAHTFLLNRMSKTCGSDPSWSATPLQVICCDFEPCLIARSLLHLQLLLGRPSSDGRDVTVDDIVMAWEVANSMFITPEAAGRLQRAAQELCDSLEDDDKWSREGLGRFGVYVTGDKVAVVKLLKWWCEGLEKGIFSGRIALTSVRTARRRMSDALGVGEAYDQTFMVHKVNGGDPRLEELTAAYVAQGFVGLEGILASTGVVLSPTEASERKCVNPTFLAGVYDFPKKIAKLPKGASASEVAKVWRVHYFANPYQSCPLDLIRCLEELSRPSTKFVTDSRSTCLSPAQWCFELFGQRSEAMASALTTGRHQIVLHCGDAFALCDALRPRDPRATLPSLIPKVKKLRATLTGIQFPNQFDFIDTSNIGDNTGVLPLLLACAPLLASKADNPRASLATDVMKGRGNNEEEVVQDCLSNVPLWLIPFSCGLQLDFARSTVDHHDSAAKRDPSSLWMAYPRSFSSFLIAIALQHGMVPMRWRRCYAGFNQVSVSDSNDLKASIYRAFDIAVRLKCDRPVGLNTFVRLVDSLAAFLSPDCIDGLMQLFEEGAIMRLVQKKPFSTILGYALSLSGLLDLHGGLYDFEKDLRIRRAVTLYDVTVKIGRDWKVHRDGQEKQAFARMARKNDSSGSLEKRRRGGPDYCLVSVVLNDEGIHVVFPVESVDGDELHIFVPDVVVHYADTGRVYVTYSSLSVIEESFEADAKVLRKKPLSRSLYLPGKYHGTGVKDSSLAVREWRADGSVRFVAKLRGKELASLQKKEKVEVNERVGEPQTVDVVTAGATLHTFTLPVEVAVNDVHMKVSRGSGSLDIIIPALYCCPLGSLTGDALPRSIFSTSRSGESKVSVVPSVADATLKSVANSQGWMNRGLFGRMLPLKIRANKSTATNQLRESLALVYSTTLDDRAAGKEYGGRAIMSLARGTSSDVIMLLSPNTTYDWIHGLVIKGAVCILKHEFVYDVAPEVSRIQSRRGMRSITVDESCGEFECWTDHYLPAAMELARVTRGIPRSRADAYNCAVCGSTKPSHLCKDAEKFWMSWLDWKKIPLSSKAMRHFKPMVIFPLFSSVMSYSLTGKAVPNPVNDANTILESMQERLAKDPTATAEVMGLLQQMSNVDPSKPPKELIDRLRALIPNEKEARETPSGGMVKARVLPHRLPLLLLLLRVPRRMASRLETITFALPVVRLATSCARDARRSTTAV